VWAGGILSTVVTHPLWAGILVILYPLWDVACTLYDLKTSEAGSVRTSLIINAVLGCATALGIAFIVFYQPAYAVTVFGVWALGAGLLQLGVGLIRRRQLGGQWAMIVSGAQSTAAGLAFTLGGLSGKFHIKDLGGYAVFGAVYFLVGGILLSRKLSQLSSWQARAAMSAH
jgi:uncharacterized membrane protein HdeD (DUF308 family)